MVCDELVVLADYRDWHFARRSRIQQDSLRTSAYGKQHKVIVAFDRNRSADGAHFVQHLAGLKTLRDLCVEARVADNINTTVPRQQPRRVDGITSEPVDGVSQDTRHVKCRSHEIHSLVFNMEHQRFPVSLYLVEVHVITTAPKCERSETILKVNPNTTQDGQLQYPCSRPRSRNEPIKQRMQDKSINKQPAQRAPRPVCFAHRRTQKRDRCSATGNLGRVVIHLGPVNASGHHQRHRSPFEIVKS